MMGIVSHDIATWQHILIYLNHMCTRIYTLYMVFTIPVCHNIGTIFHIKSYIGYTMSFFILFISTFIHLTYNDAFASHQLFLYACSCHCFVGTEHTSACSKIWYIGYFVRSVKYFRHWQRTPCIIDHGNICYFMIMYSCTYLGYKGDLHTAVCRQCRNDEIKMFPIFRECRCSLYPIYFRRTAFIFQSKRHMVIHLHISQCKTLIIVYSQRIKKYLTYTCNLFIDLFFYPDFQLFLLSNDGTVRSCSNTLVIICNIYMLIYFNMQSAVSMAAAAVG